jgi:hypothetical protein
LYAFQVWQRYQSATLLMAAFHLLPYGRVSVHAAYIVLKILHVVSMRVIIAASIIAFGLDSILYLHQNPSYNYWARFMPGIGTDLSSRQQLFLIRAMFRGAFGVRWVVCYF